MGDQLLLGDPSFVTGGTDPALLARSLVTGATSTVLTSSFGGIGPTLDGGAPATAGPSSLDRTIHRITPTSGSVRRLHLEAHRPLPRRTGGRTSRSPAR
ncbi:hypothetical protein [Streptomyces viridochromogenes]|uniref:hypothetical protein n=1 Tax=Streptomyces viridochromogenes TaxID=1938 RepID=UPI0001B4D310|nr:hypothetical protein [Streptomyces viridochromogenes]